MLSLGLVFAGVATRRGAQDKSARSSNLRHSQCSRHSFVNGQHRNVTSIQCLLDKLGKPPKEVCLDWAWQLKQLGQSTHTDDTHEVQLTWQDVRVADDGTLLIQRSADHATQSKSRGRTTEELCHELLSWCDAADIPIDAEPNRLALETLTLQLAQDNSDPDAAAIQSETDSSNLVDESKVSTSQSTTIHRVAAREKVATREDDDTVASKGTGAAKKLPAQTRASSQTHQPKFSRRSMIVVASSCATLLLITATWYVLFTPETLSEKSAASLNSGLDTSATQSDPTASARGAASFKGTAPDISQLADANPTLNDLAEIQTTQAADSLSNSFNELALPSLGTLTDSIDANNAPSDTVTPRDAQNVATPSADGEPRNTTSEITVANASDTGNVNIATEGLPSTPEGAGETMDVMATMADVARQSELAKTETDLVANDGTTEGEDRQLHPPVLLPTFPMFQIHKLPARLKARAKNPAWQIRLAVSEGFTVEPNSPQTFSGRETATWRIKDEKNENSSAQILIQTQASGTRGSNLRWRIVAGAPDIPQVVLPLGREYLDAMQLNLSNFATQLQFEIDRLRSLSNADGIPGKVRSAITNQRKGYEAQQKLLARVLEVVADANQMEGWMDGQFEVHARYLDLSARPDASLANEAQPEDSTALLQFGVFPEAATSEPAPPKPAGADIQSEEVP